MAAKLPTAVPKEVGPLAWAILAASKDEQAKTPGLTVHIAENGGRMVVATDLHRFHIAAVPDMTPLPPGVYRPPGWDSPDWHPAGDAWEVDWVSIREASMTWPRLRAGHVARVDQLFGQCRAAIAYGQSTEWEIPLIWLQHRAFSARAVADAISGGYGAITGAELELAQSRDGQHLLRVRHVCGDALVMGVGGDPVKAARDGLRPEFSGDEDVKWEVVAGPAGPSQGTPAGDPETGLVPRLQMLSVDEGQDMPFTEDGDEPEGEELPPAAWAGDPEPA